MKLKHIIVILLCVVLLTGCGANNDSVVGDSSQGTTQEEQLNLGMFSANTLDGDTITHEFFAKEKLTLINVWATFCGPCKMEMPGLGQLDREMEDFQVMGVVMDVLDQDGNIVPEQVETAKQLKEATNVEYPSAIINQSLANIGLAAVTSYPTSIFVDSKGNIVGDLVVGARDEEGWKEIIQERLDMVKEDIKN